MIPSWVKQACTFAARQAVHHLREVALRDPDERKRYLRYVLVPEVLDPAALYGSKFGQQQIAEVVGAKVNNARQKLLLKIRKTGTLNDESVPIPQVAEDLFKHTEALGRKYSGLHASVFQHIDEESEEEKEMEQEVEEEQAFSMPRMQAYYAPILSDSFKELFHNCGALDSDASRTANFLKTIEA
eukprot:g35198.t1